MSTHGLLARNEHDFFEHGYSHVTMHFEVPSGTIDELFESVERFAAEVLPAARDLEAAPLQ